MMKRFGPPYLTKGSDGPFVLAMQIAIKAAMMPHEAALNIICDGEFGDMTELGVKCLQSNLGFEGSGVDGCFGPRTRDAFFQKYGIDFNSMPYGIFAGETTWFNGDKNMGVWTGEIAEDPRRPCRCSAPFFLHDEDGIPDQCSGFKEPEQAATSGSTNCGGL